MYHNVGLWLDGECRSNFVLANVKGVREPWAVITDEDPTLQTLWQYALRFRIEGSAYAQIVVLRRLGSFASAFLDSKSGAFKLEESKIRHPKALERLYLVVALAILFTTAHGMVIQLKGLRKRVDPHYRRGLSYLKIGIRWLKGVMHKGRYLFDPQPLFSQDIQPCFASKKNRREYYDAIWFTRISEVKCLNI